MLAVLQDNAASLLKLARRYSLCADDAQDAYQRALEIYLRRIDQVRAATVGEWLRTVVKHEALAIREARARLLADEGIDFDEMEAPELSSGEERALSFDRVTRAAEALRSCKRDEVAAMVLRADGHSYDEILSVTGWSYTKLNRCLSEGRARFIRRYTEIETGEECDRLAPILSLIVDGEASPVQMAEARPHLRNCTACRATLRELSESQAAIHIAVPAAAIYAGAQGGGGFLTRAYELLFGGIHDRVALTAMKTQSAIEAVSATKVAAVTASAAAIAGGGAVAVERVDSKATPAARTEPRSRAAATPTAGTIPRAPRTRPALRALPHRRSATTSAKRKRTANTRRARTARAEFSFEGTGTASARPRAHVAAATAAPPPRPKKQTSRRTSSGEAFGFER